MPVKLLHRNQYIKGAVQADQPPKPQPTSRCRTREPAPARLLLDVEHAERPISVPARVGTEGGECEGEPHRCRIGAALGSVCCLVLLEQAARRPRVALVRRRFKRRAGARGEERPVLEHEHAARGRGMVGPWGAVLHQPAQALVPGCRTWRAGFDTNLGGSTSPLLIEGEHFLMVLEFADDYGILKLL